MSSSLFSQSETKPTAADVLAESQLADNQLAENQPSAEEYRAMSAPAVISLVTGLMTALTFTSPAFGALGLAGIVVGFVALKKIKAEPHYYTGGVLAVVGIVASFVFLAGGGSYHAYVYATEVPEGYTRINYDQLRDPNIASSEFQLPPESAKQLDNEKIFIKGYMYPPPGKQPGQKVNSFVLCRDNGDCCFGGDPPVLERIWVTVPEGETVTYTTSMLKLAGTFNVFYDISQQNETVGTVFYTLAVDQVR